MPHALKFGSHDMSFSKQAQAPCRYSKLLSDAKQKTYRVLAAFQTPDLDMAYDVAEGMYGLSVGPNSRPCMP